MNVKGLISLRGRLRSPRYRTSRSPTRCAVCRLTGHNWAGCEIRVRLNALGIPIWLRGFNQ